jgi:hypothetical protein
VNVVQFDFAYNTGAPIDSTTLIPANAVPIAVYLQIKTTFNGSATIAVGYSGSTSFLMATTDNLPGTIGYYSKDLLLDSTWGGGVDREVLVTIGGTPSTGTARVRVLYTTAVNP